MYQLVIDPLLCGECGSCEEALPGLRKKMAANRLLLSPANAERHHVDIQRAIDSCRMDALTIEEVTECSTAPSSAS